MKKVLAVLTACFFYVCCDAYALQYRLTDLGTLGGTSSMSLDINDSGQVVGQSDDGSGGTCAFIWDSSNGMVNISGNNNGGAYAVNSNGDVAGHYNSGTLPFRWTQATGFEPLQTARPGNPIGNYGVAFGISDSGVAVGHRSGASPTYWEPLSGNAVQLSLYSGRQYAIAGDLSDTSHIIGAAYTYDANGTNHLAVYWTSPSSVSLFSMQAGAVESNPHDINVLNQTVGWNKDDQGVYHAILWDTLTSTPFELGIGQAWAISNDGLSIVGVDGDNNTVIWLNENGEWSQAYGLNDMLDNDGWTITSVGAINTSGFIAATASNGVDTRAVLLSPYESQAIPEPLTVISLFMAFIVLRFSKRK